MRRYSQLLVAVFFIVVLLTGVSIHRDYGLSWDEHTSHANGILSYRYVTAGDRALFSHVERYHGAAFELLLVLVERISGVTDSQQVFFQRHLLTFLLFYTALAAFYILLRMLGRSRLIALAGVGILVLSPRIFADSFYNSKDLAFLSAFLLAVTTGVRFLRRPGLLTAALHAVCAAFAIDIRLWGVFVPLAVVAVYLVRTVRMQGRRSWRNLAWLLGILTGGVVLFWPVLWENPPVRLWEAVREMQRFPWNWYVLYGGTYYRAAELPWHYIPVWIAVTTPLTWLLLAGVGVLRAVLITIRRPAAGMAYLPVLAWLIGPWLLVVAFRSTVYDAWRHLFFIYPALVVLAVDGVAWAAGGLRRADRRIRAAALVVLLLAAVQALAVAAYMVRVHPYQHVYFNSLAGGMRQAKLRFQLDYWGLSFRQGMEYIAAHDPAPVIPVFLVNGPAGATAILSAAQRQRIVQVHDPKTAAYVISIYRGYEQEYPPAIPEFFSIPIDGVNILVVFKVPAEVRQQLESFGPGVGMPTRD